MQRNYTIDHLRGLGILIVLFLHVLALYLNRPFVYPIWDYFHFAVPIFVFCATYVFYAKSLNHDNFHYPSYLAKRLIRLLKPYYIFLLTAFFIMSFYEGSKLTLSYILSNIFLYGGIDINWLVLLFVEFIILLPFLRYLILYHKKIFHLYSFISLGSCFLLLLYKPEIHYKLYFWIPWSIILVITYYFYTYHEKKYFHIMVGFLSMAIYFISHMVLSMNNESLQLFQNKYPPNTFYLFYGVFLLNILYLLSKKRIFSHPIIHGFLSYLSSKSFELYFIHYLILYIFVNNNWHSLFPWPIFFVVIVAGSIIIQRIINKLIKLNN